MSGGGEGSAGYETKEQPEPALKPRKNQNNPQGTPGPRNREKKISIEDSGVVVPKAANYNVCLGNTTPQACLHLEKNYITLAPSCKRAGLIWFPRAIFNLKEKRI